MNSKVKSRYPSRTRCPRQGDWLPFLHVISLVHENRRNVAVEALHAGIVIDNDEVSQGLIEIGAFDPTLATRSDQAVSAKPIILGK